MSYITYIVEAVVCSGLFILLYRTLLEGRIPHKAARAYLLAGMAAAAILPALEIPLYKSEIRPLIMDMNPYYDALVHEVMPASPAVGNEASAMTERQSEVTGILATAAAGIYLAILAVNLTTVMARLCRIFILRRKSKIYKHGNYSLAINDEVSDPFSFMNTVYMNRETGERGCAQIMAHEASHIRHHHTMERLFMELMRCVFWFNPFVWIAGQNLIDVQEWEADADVLDEGYDLNEYRTIIFSRLIGCNPDMTSGLHNKTTQKRFIMMTKDRRDKFSLIRLLMALPLAAGMFFAFSCTTGRAEQKSTLPEISGFPSDSMTRVTFTAPAKGEIMHIFGLMTSLEGETFPHNSVDFKVKSDDPIHAAADGTVSEVSYQDPGYGKYIRIDHEQGYQSFYAHLTEIHVKEGDKVARGDKIGRGGDTGRVVTPHLQFSIMKDGRYVDPLTLFPAGDSKLPAKKDIIGKWLFSSYILVGEKKDLKRQSQEEYEKIAKGLNLTKGSDYVEFTKNGELLLVNGKTQATQKARYTYNPEKAELTIDMGIVKYTAYLTQTGPSSLAAVVKADNYLSVSKGIGGKIQNNEAIIALEALSSEYDDLILGAMFRK